MDAMRGDPRFHTDFDAEEISARLHANRRGIYVTASRTDRLAICVHYFACDTVWFDVWVFTQDMVFEFVDNQYNRDKHKRATAATMADIVAYYRAHRGASVCL